MFAEDIYDTNFARAPHSKEAWQQLRRQVLEHGGSREETVILRNYLGRDPSLRGILTSLGAQ